MINANGTLFFSANDGTNGTELWKSDGTDAGTTQVKDINPGAASSFPGNDQYLNPESPFAAVGGTVFFRADDGTNGFELWKSDGTDAGTTRISDINAGAPGTQIYSLTNVGGTVFFSAADNGTINFELWKSNGTLAGTTKVNDLKDQAGGSYPDNLTDFNGTLFFNADPGPAPRRSCGSPTAPPRAPSRSRTSTRVMAAATSVR